MKSRTESSIPSDARRKKFLHIVERAFARPLASFTPMPARSTGKTLQTRENSYFHDGDVEE
jgi:hypothetical protein